MGTNLAISTFSFFISSLFHCNKTIWKGYKPSRAAQIRMNRKSQRQMKRAVVLNYLDLKEFGKSRVSKFYYDNLNSKLFFGIKLEQLVQRNSSDDSELLSKSLLNIFPHEVMQVRIHSTSEQVFYSKIRHGKMFSVGKIELIKKDIYKLIKRMRESGDRAVLIEIVHTHPSYEAYYTDGESSAYMINGLSESDVKVVKLLREFIEIPTQVKAVSASGVNYSVEI